MRLSGGPYTIELAPEIGGAVSGLWFEQDGLRTPVLRPAGSGETDPTGCGCFPLAAFCNRLREGRLRFRGRTFDIPPNRPGERHPLHGQAWLAPWNAEKLGPDQARMRFRHEPGHWPWRYEAEQSILAADNGVALSLEIRNLDDQAMPAGIGLHPYFPAGDRVTIRTGVEGVLLTDAEHLPTGEVAPALGAYGLSDRLISGAGLDHGFTGWSGQLEILYPDHVVRVSASSNASWLQVYAPTGEDYFCAEPVTHANGALALGEADWEDQGIRILEPGQSLRMDMRLEVLVNPFRPLVSAPP